MPVERGFSGRMHRMGERAFGLLLLGRVVLSTVVVALLVVAGVWTSWARSGDAVLDDRVRGTLTVRSCARQQCSGTFVPSGRGGARPGVVIQRSLRYQTGTRLAVALQPGGRRVVRTGLPGLLAAWVPFGGALLMVSLVVAGGLGMRRTGLGVGLAGVALLGASFVALRG